MAIATQNQINSIEDGISILQVQKSALVIRKRELELENAEIKYKIRTGGVLSNSEYNKLCSKQNSVKREVLEIEKQLSQISFEIRSKLELKDRLKKDISNTYVNETKNRLIELKNQYISFAADKSRVNSMRAMAAEFAEKLEKIIVQL